MDDRVYQERAAFIHTQFQKAGVPDGSVVLDLGCRDGGLTEALTDVGYEMIGVDDSADLLAAAMDRMVYDEHKNLYIQQEILSVDLGCQVRAIVSTDGVLNGMMTDEDLSAYFRRVFALLETDGVFFFDFYTSFSKQGPGETSGRRAYTLAQVKELLEAEGLSFRRAFADYSEQEPDETCGRICVLAGK